MQQGEYIHTYIKTINIKNYGHFKDGNNIGLEKENTYTTYIICALIYGTLNLKFFVAFEIFWD